VSKVSSEKNMEKLTRIIHKRKMYNSIKNNNCFKNSLLYPTKRGFFLPPPGEGLRKGAIKRITLTTYK